MLSSLGRWRPAVFAGAMALLIIPNLSHLQPQRFHDVDLAFWTPAQIAWRGVDVATAGEYRPHWMQTMPPFDARGARIITGDGEFRQTERSPVSWSGRVLAKKDSEAEMAIAYFPGWEVRIDGRTVETDPADNTGLIRFRVPAGDHRVDAVWTRTAALWAGDGISLLSLLLLLVWSPDNKIRFRSRSFVTRPIFTARTAPAPPHSSSRAPH
jgi:hypothetical protein